MLKLLVFVVGMQLLVPVYGAEAEPELLEPDIAFRLVTSTRDSNTLEATWQIAPGYYLYRDKFKFESLNPAITLKPPRIPSGKKKQDPFFGNTEIFTNSVTVALPFERRGAGVTTAQLRITAQGCNEPVGVCYPPIVKNITFKLAAVSGIQKQDGASSSPGSKNIGSLKELKQLLEPGGEQPVIDPEQAFRIQVAAVDAKTLRVRFDIADCCYLYRDKTHFEVDGTGVRLGPVNLPAGKPKQDEFVGTTEVYYQGLEVRLPLEGLSSGAQTLALKVGYQGCSEKGVAICYPPTNKKFHISTSGGAISVQPLAATGTALPSPAPATETPTERGAWWLAILAAFGAGLLLTFTPCVLPMVPILSSAVVGSGKEPITKGRAGLLSYSYVFGTAVTYTIAGIVAGATGEQLQAYFQNPWAIGTFSGLLVFLALSMFGFYELQMPSFIQSRLYRRTTRLPGGSLIGVFVLGLLSALIIGACVTPILIGVLSTAIISKDPLLGGAMMLALAHGQGVFLVAIGVGAGALFPKAGPWMDQVKKIFGVLLLAVAIYLLGYLPQVPVLFLWATLLIVSAIYLGATDAVAKNASGWSYLRKGVGTLFLIWGVAALICAWGGNRDVFNPLAGVCLAVGPPPSTTQNESPPSASLFKRVGSMRELQNELAAAQKSGKPVILDYYATWCTDCVRMEKSTFLDPRVQQELRERFVTLQADVTDPNHPEAKAIKQRFGVYGPPAMLFFAANGEERRELRTYGYKSPDAFLNLLRKL